MEYDDLSGIPIRYGIQQNMPSSKIYKMSTNSLQKASHHHQQTTSTNTLHKQTNIFKHLYPNNQTVNMRTSFTTLFVLSGLIASSVATPAHFRRQATDVCATGTPNCCDVDVLGIADLDCTTRKSLNFDFSGLQFSQETMLTISSQLHPSQQLLLTSPPSAPILERMPDAAILIS